MSERATSHAFLFATRPHAGACPACCDTVVPVALARLVRGVPGRGLRLGPFPSVHWLCQTCRAATRQPALPDHTGRSIGDRPGAHQHR